MMKYFTTILLLLLTVTAHAKEMPIVRVQTNLGTIVLELNPDKAPITVDNFIRYIQAAFYEGLIFHRVIKGFVIQTGGYTLDHEKRIPIYEPIPNESNNGLQNLRGTIAMSRISYEPDSATSQFFINVRDNKYLDYEIDINGGYTVFGRVIRGMDVADKIQKIKIVPKGSLKTLPEFPVIIEKVTIKNIPIKPKAIVPAEKMEKDIAPVKKVTPENISKEPKVSTPAKSSTAKDISATVVNPETNIPVETETQQVAKNTVINPETNIPVETETQQITNKTTVVSSETKIQQMAKKSTIIDSKTNISVETKTQKSSLMPVAPPPLVEITSKKTEFQIPTNFPLETPPDPPSEPDWSEPLPD